MDTEVVVRKFSVCHAVYLMSLNNSGNKQMLFIDTTLTECFFLMKAHCVLCEVQTESLYIMLDK